MIPAGDLADNKDSLVLLREGAAGGAGMDTGTAKT